MQDFKSITALLQNILENDKIKRIDFPYRPKYKNFTSFFLDSFTIKSYFQLKH